MSMKKKTVKLSNNLINFYC